MSTDAMIEVDAPAIDPGAPAMLDRLDAEKILVFAVDGADGAPAARAFGEDRSLVVSQREHFIEALGGYDDFVAAVLVLPPDPSDLFASQNAAESLVWLTNRLRPRFPVVLVAPVAVPLAAGGPTLVRLAPENLDELAAKVRNAIAELGSSRALMQALRESEQQFQALSSHLDAALWVRTINGGRYLYMGPQYAQIHGVPVERLYDGRIDDQFAPILELRLRNDLRVRDSVAAREPYVIEYPLDRGDGETRNIRETGFPIFEEDGTALRYGGMIRDVTVETRLAQEAQLVNRLESVSQLAAGIAHEINTPCQYLSGNLHFMAEAVRDLRDYAARVAEVAAEIAARGDAALHARLREAATDADLDYLLENLPGAVDRSIAGVESIARIVRAMHDFSGPGSDELKAEDLGAILERVATLSANEWKYHAVLRVEAGAGLPALTCYPQLVTQAVLNLVDNASKAIAESGREGGEIVLRGYRAGEFLAVEVADNGAGIADAIAGKVFDPFFTTREVGRGTGQGLTIARRIVVDTHSGRIGLRSRPGETVFTLLLPIDGPGCAG